MDFGTVQQVDIDEQMRAAYLDYAMSVIVSRALPDARDGLKPVHGAFSTPCPTWAFAPILRSKNPRVS